MGLIVSTPGVGLSMVNTRRFRSGWYTLLGNNLGTSNTLGNGSLRLYPAEIPMPIRINRIGAEITAAGDVGCVLRMAVYLDDGTGIPGIPLADAGTITADAVGVFENVIDLPVSPGVLWVGGVVQGVAVTQPTVRVVVAPAVETGLAAIGPVAPTPNTSAVGFSQGGIAGVLPAQFVPLGAAGAAPRIHVRVA